MSIKQKSISGVKWNSFSATFNVLMAVAKTAIMARLLTPEDFGLMAMVEAVIVFGGPLAEMGLGMAIIQARHITTKQLSTLYWLNIALGIFVFFLMLTISPFVADFYKEEKLTTLLVLVAISFVIGPIGAQFNVLFQKELNFDLPVKIDSLSNIISFIITIFLAYIGWGVYSLVLGKLARTITNTTLLVFYGLRSFKPQLHFNLSEAKSLLGFGGFQMGERYAYLLASNWDKILIGKLLGAEMLGFYNIATTLIVVPLHTINPIINKVMFPVFSQIKDDNKKVNQYFQKGIGFLMAINVPLYIGIAIVANELVPIFFGSQWMPSIPILQIAAITYLFTSFSNPGGSIIIAKGRADISFYWSIINSISLLLFILLAYYVEQSLISCAIGILLQTATIGSLWHVIISRIGGIKYSPLIKNIGMLLMFGLAMYLVIEAINFMFSFTNDSIKLAINVIAGAVVYISLTLIFNPNIQELIQLFISNQKRNN